MLFNRIFVRICLAITFLSFKTTAQIVLSHPMERMVFQRNNANQGTITIAGTYLSEVDRIEARVVPKWSGSGTSTNWTVIQNNPSNGYFSGTLTVQGGWYQLEVNAYKNNNLVDGKIIERVGVGEVFAIAGQSNAQGGAGVSTSANDDRVSTIDYTDAYSDYNRLPIGFSKLTGDSTAIGPFHYVPWAWGRLGDLLVQRLNVPVLFYGAGHGGTSSDQWSKSSQGLPFDGPDWIRRDHGAPYRALENSVSIYASLTGLRAVLWHQGESDPDTFFETYYNNVKDVINKTRENSEHSDLAWVVARASVNPGEHINVIIGQDALISGFYVNGYSVPPVPNVFAGPNTDQFQGGPYRSDGIHFDTYAGQIEFANAWDASMNNDFFNNSNPMMPSPLLAITLACSPNNPSSPITLTVPGSYSQYYWSNRDNTDNEARGRNSSGCCNYTFLPPAGYERLNWTTLPNTNSVTVAPARFAASARKPSKKTLFSPIINLSTFPLPTTPTITTSVTQVRPGESVTLTGSGCNTTYLWSTGATTNPLVVSPPATTSYSVQCKTVYCSVSSTPKNITVSSCFPNSLFLTNSVANTQSPYQSKQIIQSTQKIQATGKIDYTAKNRVELLPGFESKNGSVFKATVEDCN
ncbi:3-coathanger stack domain-containing protein [Emticicia soli]|uniref:3-coathanger stack domain-containing protein n=1 Tax=Emticicia soli TaxID=2027878 RepID=A0ABW5J8N8_9BACT